MQATANSRAGSVALLLQYIHVIDLPYTSLCILFAAVTVITPQKWIALSGLSVRSFDWQW